MTLSVKMMINPLMSKTNAQITLLKQVKDYLIIVKRGDNRREHKKGLIF